MSQRPGDLGSFLLAGHSMEEAARLSAEYQKKYGDKLSSKWDPYLKYKPLLCDATDKQIEEFFNLQSENICKLCPANKTIGYKPINSPMMSVKRKEKLYNN